MRDIFGEIDDGHPAATDLALNAISLRQRDLKLFELHCVAPRRREVRKHITAFGEVR
jgi:hypothetical protein